MSLEEIPSSSLQSSQFTYYETLIFHTTFKMLAAHLFLLAAAGTAYAHTAAFAPGMYCRGGPNPNVDDQNTSNSAKIYLTT